jgi:hypothetical protein
MTKKDFFTLFGAVVWLGVIAAICYGWIANIITIAHSNFNDITGLLVLRVVGIFIAPIGAVLGYI